jgi:hypothetical protein
MKHVTSTELQSLPNLCSLIPHVLAQICFKKRQILGGVGRILHSIEINVKQRCFRVDSLTFLYCSDMGFINAYIC